MHELSLNVVQSPIIKHIEEKFDISVSKVLTQFIESVTFSFVRFLLQYGMFW